MTAASRAQDLDVAAMTRALRPVFLPILLLATILAALTFVISAGRPKVYATAASIAALPPSSGNSTISNSLVTAPPLPSGVVLRAIRSPGVTEQAIQILQKNTPDSPERKLVISDLQAELRTGDFRTVAVAADIDQNMSGSYTISAKAHSPEVAQATANAFAAALLQWDRNRALDGVNRASNNLISQLSSLKDNETVGGQTIDSRTIDQMRSDTLRQLQQVEVLKQTVSGTLSLIAGAIEPVNPIAPRPARNAFLVFGAALFFGLLTALIRDRLIRRVSDEETLRSLALPVLALVPRVPMRRNASSATELLHHGNFRQSLEFVRVGLMSKFETHLSGPPIVAVTSANIGEGKSMVTAGLALNFANRGSRVLVVDADPYRKRQQLALLGGKPESEARPAGVRTLQTAEIWPQVSPNIDVMCLLSPRLEPAQLNQDVRFFSASYDIILVDTPPALNIADTLEFVRLLDGVLLVTNQATRLHQVERLVNEIQRLGVTPLGFILNRSTENHPSESPYDPYVQMSVVTQERSQEVKP